MVEKEKEKESLKEMEQEIEERSEGLLKDSLRFEDFVSNSKEENGTPLVSEEERVQQGENRASEEVGMDLEGGGVCGISEEEYHRLQEQYRETKELLLRVAADFENFKRRSAKEKEDLVKYANESLLRDLLDTADNLELTLLHSQNQSVKSEDIVKGFEITVKGFLELLKKFGVVPLEIEDDLFDPRFHEAIAAVESKDRPAGHIIKVERKGYMLKDRLLRPALVVVSKGVAVSSETANETDNKTAEHICIAEPEPNKDQ